jgi:hypothetical protein
MIVAWVLHKFMELLKEFGKSDNICWCGNCVAEVSQMESTSEDIAQEKLVFDREAGGAKHSGWLRVELHE